MKPVASFNLFIVTLCVFVFACKLQITDARLYGWGANDWGQMGLGNFQHPKRTIQTIPFYEDKGVKEVRAGTGYHFALLEDGRAFCSGNNFYGQLGVINRTNFIVDVVENEFMKDCDVIAGINNVNGFCPNTKSVWGWGYAAGYMIEVMGRPWYKPWEALPKYGFQGKVESVSSVMAGVFIRLNNNTVWAAGEGWNGRLGLGDTKNYSTFARMTFWDNVPLRQISPSQSDHVCALATNRTLYCWGANSRGQLGLGDLNDRLVPTRVPYFDDEEHILLDVLTADGHSLALTCGGRVFTWGDNLFGQLGLNYTGNTTEAIPKEVEVLRDKDIVEIVIGNNQNYARTSSHDWYVWGGGGNGILGLGHDLNQYTPVLNPKFKELGITHIVIGSAAATGYGMARAGVPTTRVQCPPMLNECEIGNHTCFDLTKGGECVDTDRFYKCRCQKGYFGDGYAEGTGCTDINECDTNTDMCVDEAECFNTEGSYYCDCPEGHHGDGLDPSVGGDGCIKDVNECNLIFPCDINAICNDTLDSYECYCPPGFMGNGYKPPKGDGCIDIDECANGNLTCGTNAYCENVPGSASCKCWEGYGGDPHVLCEDIDECATGTHKCSPNAVCTNLIGAQKYKCTCQDGFYGDGFVCYVVDGSVTGDNTTTSGDTGVTTFGNDAGGTLTGGESGTLGDIFLPHDNYNNSEYAWQVAPPDEVDGTSSIVIAMIALFVSIVGVLIILAIVFSVMVYRRRRYA